MSMTTKIAWLTDEQLEMFKSDFKVVARFFVNKRRNPDYVADDPTEIQHVDEVLKLLSVMTGDRDYEKVIYRNGLCTGRGNSGWG